MKLIGTCMAANEADVIEAFVRHNLRLLDALVVLDHGSLDGTAEILAELGREGLPLTVLRDQDRAFRQGERQTFMARRYLPELGADFCFALDADELLRCESRAALERALAALPPAHAGLVPLQNFFRLEGGPLDDPPRAITRRLREERRVTRKAVLPRAFATDGASQVSLGNHAAVRVEGRQVTPWPHAALEGVQLAHYPVRSADQAARKALLGWLSHQLTQPEKLFGERARAKDAPAAHWRDLYGALVKGEVGVDDRLVARANAHYAHGPVAAEDLVDDALETAYTLRYGRAAMPALPTLAAWTHQLVVEANARPEAT